VDGLKILFILTSAKRKMQLVLDSRDKCEDTWVVSIKKASSREKNAIYFHKLQTIQEIITSRSCV
jgi:hypothetical protein